MNSWLAEKSDEELIDFNNLNKRHRKKRARFENFIEIVVYRLMKHFNKIFNSVSFAVIIYINIIYYNLY